MSGESSQTGDEPSTSVLLSQYECHREETLKTMELQDKLLIRGFAVVGAVIGYSFYRPENRVLLALLPIAIGLFFWRHISLSHGMVRLAIHMREIEEKIDIDSFDWETRFGASSEKDFSYELLPIAFLASIIILLYVVSIGAALYVVPAYHEIAFGLGVGSILLASGYLMYTALLAALILTDALAMQKRREAAQTSEKAPVLKELDIPGIRETVRAWLSHQLHRLGRS